MKFYNTLTRKLDEFTPINNNLIKIYTCGPTVYNYAHIGNWRSFIFADLLRRYLKFKGYNLLHVMNLTDVDDKTIRDSQKEGVSLNEFTERYTKIFFDDMDTLYIERVDAYPKATEHIQEILDITKTLLDQGIAYKSEDGSTYFSIKKFPEYGKLSKIKFDQLQSGARVKHDEYEKETANDFALWKSYDAADGDVYWETDLGKGRPGWHIECSAMSMKYLGPSFDIHTGGIDLTFPHHENEIAQSEACTHKPFVNYWLHCEHLLVDGVKMSKSKGNFYVLKDILQMGSSARAVRYLLLSTHYRTQLNFTMQGLEAAQQSLDKFDELIRKLLRITAESTTDVNTLIQENKTKFIHAMDEDLNISQGLAVIFEFVSVVNNLLAEQKVGISQAKALLSYLKELDSVLGVMSFEQSAIPNNITQLVKDRENARSSKDWKKADELRQRIEDAGYVVEDTNLGSIVKEKRL